MPEELLPVALRDAIAESEYAELITQALSSYATTMTRQAGLRGNAGPIMAPHREHLRKRATLARRAANELREVTLP